MSASVGELAVQLSANTQPMVNDMKIAERALSSFSAAGEKMGSSLMKLTAQGASFGLGFIGVSHIMESLKHGFEIVEQNEKAAVSFKVLMGSAEAAKDMLKDLKHFAGETGMRFADARAGAAGLLKFGFNPEEIKPMLKVIGDFSTISMDGQQESMQRIIQLFGVIKDQGSLTARNMKALAAEGVEPWKALGEQLGVTRQELKRLLEAGEIDSATGLFAIQGAMRDKSFGGMNEDAKRMSRSIEDMKKAADGFWADLVGWGIETLHLDKEFQHVALGMKVIREQAKGIYGTGKTREFTTELNKVFASGAGMVESSVMDDMIAGMNRMGTTDAGKWFSEQDAARQAEILAGIKDINAETEFNLALDESDLKIQEQIVAQEKLKAQQLEHTTQQMEDYIAQLQVAHDTFGMSDHEKKMAKFAKAGASDEMLEQAEYEKARNDTQIYYQKLMEDGKKITEQYRTEQEKTSDTIAHLNTVLAAGGLDFMTYMDAINKNNPGLQEFIKETKAVEEEIQKLMLGEEAYKLSKLGDANDRKKLQGLMNQRDVWKEINAMQQEANRLIQLQLSPMEKMNQEVAKVRKMYLSGFLNDDQFNAKMKAIGAEYQKAMGKDEGPKFAGAVEAGSREAYSSMVAASAGTQSNRDIAQKQLDETTTQTTLLRAATAKIPGIGAALDGISQLQAPRVMTLGGPS